LEQLKTFDEARVEKLIKDASDNHLQYITLLGGVLGFLGGLVLWNPMTFVWLAILGIFILGVDASMTWFFQTR